MFHKINILPTKVLSHFYAVCLGKRASVHIVTSTDLTYLWNNLAPSLVKLAGSKKIKVAKTRFSVLGIICEVIIFFFRKWPIKLWHH